MPSQKLNYELESVIQSPRKRRGFPCGCVLLTFVIGIPLLIGVVAVYSAVVGLTADSPLGQLFSQLTGVTLPETVSIQGDVSRFDPLAGLAEAQALAGAEAQLVEISASYVRMDGTMDLNAAYSPAPSTDYLFLRPVPRPNDAPPVGVAGTTGGQWYEPITISAYRPGQRRFVSQLSGGVRTSYEYVNRGMTKRVGDPTTSPSGKPIEVPKCSFTDFWQVALTQDAPRDAVAIIEYDEDGYTFMISGHVFLRFDHDCKLKE
jgi:hypothetical protein